MSQEAMDTVALVGATGAIGKRAAAALRQKGRPYRVIGRSRTAVEKTFGGAALADVAVWDPDHEQSIRDAPRGIAAVVYMVGVPYTDFHLHLILMRRVIDSAITEKVDRLLLIGTLYVFGRPPSPRVTEIILTCRCGMKLHVSRMYPYRVAWHNLLDWVVAQMTLLEIEMVRLEEELLPYVVNAQGKTLFEVFEVYQFQLPLPQEK
jgi:hypothetical protein